MSAWWPPGHIIGYEHSFTHEMRDFIEAVATGADPAPSFADALQVQLVLDAVARSAELGSSWTEVEPALADGGRTPTRRRRLRGPIHASAPSRWAATHRCRRLHPRLPGVDRRGSGRGCAPRPDEVGSGGRARRSRTAARWRTAGAAVRCGRTGIPRPRRTPKPPPPTRGPRSRRGPHRPQPAHCPQHRTGTRCARRPGAVANAPVHRRVASPAVSPPDRPPILADARHCGTLTPGSGGGSGRSPMNGGGRAETPTGPAYQPRPPGPAGTRAASLPPTPTSSPRVPHR